MQNKILIVGSGLYGVTCARLLSNMGYDVLVIDKKNHIGGTCYTYKFNGITIHKYGIHVFHTSNKKVWDFVNHYCNFWQYELKVVGTDGNNIYPLPINMFLLQKIYNKITPEQIYQEIENDKPSFKEESFENKVQHMIGKKVYETIIKNYSEKQWGKSVKELPTNIIQRLPIRFSYDNRYFNDTWQGLPEGGYSVLIKNILKGVGKEEKEIQYKLGLNFLENKEYWINNFDHIIYCGSVDELLDYQLGELEWRSLFFKNKFYTFNGHNGQGCPLLNNFNKEDKYTRTIDHIYLNKNQPYVKTILTYEFPQRWDKNKERYYPIDNIENISLYKQYCNLLDKVYPKISLGGRIGLYKYMNMDDTILQAMKYVEQFKKYDRNTFK